MRLLSPFLRGQVEAKGPKDCMMAATNFGTNLKLINYFLIKGGAE
jgi:hypothetical protein